MIKQAPLIPMTTQKPILDSTLNNFLYKNNRGCRIMELELILDCDEFTIKEVHELIDLYTQAVDYYVKKQSTYYLYFQNKMKKLMLKPRVVKLIEILDTENKKLKEDSLGVVTPQKRQRDVSVGNNDVMALLKKENLEITKNLNTLHQKQEIDGVLKDLKENKDMKKRVFGSSLERQKYELSQKLDRRKSNSFRNSTNRTITDISDKSFNGVYKDGPMSMKYFNEYADDRGDGKNEEKGVRQSGLGQ